MKRIAALIVLLGLGAVVASSCGGGGGGSGGGDVAYLTVLGGGALDTPFSVATFADGSCVVVGWFHGSCTFGGGEPGETTLAAAGFGDVFIARYNADGTLGWAKRAGGTLVDVALDVDAVADGSCIVVGRFQDVATFGLGEPNATTLDDGDDLGDAFVARYNPDGTLAWAKSAGRNFWDEARSVSAHSNGSCIVTGFYNAIAIFGIGETNMTTLNAVASGQDAFVAAYHSDGSLAWARSAGGGGTDEATGVDILSDGSMLVAGSFGMPNATLGLGDPNQTTLLCAGAVDLFVARYNADGTLGWARRAGGPNFDDPDALSAFSDGGCVIGGFFRNTAIFGPGEPNQTSLTSLSLSNDIFLARYAPDGSLQWARKAGGGANGDAVWGVVAGPDGSCVMTGGFEGIAVFDQGGPGQATAITQGSIDIFVARYSADGHALWVRTAGGLGDDYGYGVALHADGSYAVCGGLFVPGVFQPGLPDEILQGGPGGTDGFVARYTADGGL